MRFTILIPSFKEKERLYNLLLTISKDKMFNKIEKIIVITPKKSKLPKIKKLKIIKEKRRRGKFYAINLGLKETKTKFVILLSSDLRMRKNFLHFLVKHLKNKKIGMVIGRPLPDKNSKIYFLSKIVWDLHHLLCLKVPKGTEICAFRKIFKEMPEVSADEVFIEYKIREKGFQIVYEPRAYGYTEIPFSLRQLFLQRKRIFKGHLQIRKNFGFSTSSLRPSLLIKIVIEYLIKNFSLKVFVFLSFLVLLELFARFVGLIEFYFLKEVEVIW